MQFALLLARTLGKTLEQLSSEMTAQEFGLWQAEYRIRPWGEFRSDIRAGIVASTIANTNRRKDTPAYKFTDFIVKFGKQVEQQEEEIPPEEFLKRIHQHG